MKPLLPFVFVALLGCGLGVSRSAAGDYLRWDKKQERVEADIEKWTVPQVLQKVAAATGWRVFVAPDIKEVVPTRFRDKAPSEALGRLLGNLNFAVMPESGASAKLYVFRSAIHEATQPIQLDSTNRIPNELVVILKPGESIDELAKKLGAKVIGRIPELNAYRLQFADAEAADKAREKLATEPSVASLDNNYRLDRPADAQRARANGSGQRTVVPKDVADGKYTVVALIDTSVQGGDATMNSFLLKGLSLAGTATGSGDTVTHGTAMAETLLNGLGASADDKGAAVRILPVDVYGNSGHSSSFMIAQGILAAAAYNPAIYNVSSGSDGASLLLYQAIQYALNNSTVTPIIFASAGNAPTGQPVYPAALPGVIGVTAGDSQGQRAAWANYGDFAPVMGPGTSLITFQGQRYLVQGTSPASAYLAGFAAGTVDSRGSTAGVRNMILNSPVLRSR